MMRLTLPFALLSTLACAETPRLVGTGPTLLWERAAVDAPVAHPSLMSAEEARSIALAHDAAHNCEVTARALRLRDRQRGWAVMEQCILRPDFTDLEALVNQPWIDDVAAHRDADTLVAHVVAVRGGDVDNDLRVVRRAHIPVFSLKAAVADPESYQGRHVLLLGMPREGHLVDGMRAVEIAETRIMAESEWVSAGPRVSTATDTTTRDDAAGTQRTQLRENYRRQEGQRVEVMHNVSVEAGRDILVDAGNDPFLEVGTDYVLLLRFDGVREAVNGTVLEERPVATVVAYFEPSSGLFARLGR